jgi:hypothetical protein
MVFGEEGDVRPNRNMIPVYGLSGIASSQDHVISGE